MRRGCLTVGTALAGGPTTRYSGWRGEGGALGTVAFAAEVTDHSGKPRHRGRVGKDNWIPAPSTGFRTLAPATYDWPARSSTFLPGRCAYDTDHDGADVVIILVRYSTDDQTDRPGTSAISADLVFQA